MLKNFFLANMNIESTDSSKRRVIMTNLTLLLLIGAFSIFTLINLLNGEWVRGLVDAFFILPPFYGLYLLHRHKNMEQASLFATILLFIALVVVVYVNNGVDFTMLWSMLFVFVVMLLQGVKKGRVYMIAFYLIVFAISYSFIGKSITQTEYIRFVGVTIAMMILAYYYESITTNAFELLNKTLTKIEDNIAFASLIQNAIVPNAEEILPRYVKEHYAIWLPRDTVGGDIFFIIELPERNELIIMVIDGAGHGVSGAFVTMLVKAIENQITSEIRAGKLESSPSKILEHFNQSIKTMLNQTQKSQSNTGFDGGVLVINTMTNEATYAGAKIALHIFNEGTYQKIKGDRFNVGFVRTKLDQTYTNHSFSITNNTQLLLSTDGYIDQETEHDKPFGAKAFERLIQELSDQPLAQQKDQLLAQLENMLSHREQSDDITLLSIKF